MESKFEKRNKIASALYAWANDNNHSGTISFDCGELGIVTLYESGGLWNVRWDKQPVELPESVRREVEW